MARLACTGVVILTLCIAIGECFPHGGEDTVVIYGATPKNSRDLKTSGNIRRKKDQPPVVLYSSGSSGEPKCLTRDGLQGQCSSFKECYPILFIADSVKNSNAVLRDDMLNSTTSCFAGTNESPVPPRFSNGNEDDYEEIICCTDAQPQSLKESEVEEGDSDKEQTSTASSVTDVLPDEGSNSIVSSCVKPNIVNPAPDSEANALPHAYPWMAVLVNGRQKQFCGGSLIDNSHVLTAAHCITQYTRPKQIQDNLRVYLGVHNLKEKEPNRVVAKVLLIMKHAKYNSRTFENDLAILRLTEPVNITKFVQPVCLEPQSMETTWENATLAGWGKTCETCELSPILRQASVKLMSNADCQKKYRSHPLFFAIPDIKAGMICALTPGMDACQGDSGGPMFLNDPKNGQFQIGIVSWGAGCASWPGVYTRVGSYLPWIHKNRNRKIPMQYS